MQTQERRRRAARRIKKAGEEKKAIQGNHYVPGLREVRMIRRLRQTDLQGLSGVHQVTISRLEWGDGRAQPETIARLAAALDVAPERLIRSEELSES